MPAGASIVCSDWTYANDQAYFAATSLSTGSITLNENMTLSGAAGYVVTGPAIKEEPAPSASETPGEKAEMKTPAPGAFCALLCLAGAAAAARRLKKDV